MVIRIATGGTGSLPFSSLFERQPAQEAATPASVRLGTFDFHGGKAADGVWCRSACQLLSWQWGTGPIDKFISQVEPADRARLAQDWKRLRAGDIIDRVVRVRIGRDVRTLRFVAGRTDEAAGSHVAGLLQDVTPSRRGAVVGTAA